MPPAAADVHTTDPSYRSRESYRQISIDSRLMTSARGSLDKRPSDD
jgi:hypothetical protein